MKYLRRQNLNVNNVLDNTVLQGADGNIELNPTQKVTINGDLNFGPGFAIPGTEVTNVMYVTLDGDDNNDGFGEGPNQAKRTLKSALEAAEQDTTIFVRSGEYYEDNPLRVPPKVSIIGDNLRNVIIRPLNGPKSANVTFVEKTDEIVTITTESPHGLVVGDRLRVRVQLGSIINATSIIPGNRYRVLTVGDTDFVAIGSKANQIGDIFKATDVGTGTGTVQWVEVDDDDVNILEVPSTTTITYRQVGSDVVGISAVGKIKWAPDLFLVNSRVYLANMVFKGLAAPAYCLNIDDDAIVDTSPYIQNCSNINGPWLKNGEEWLPFQTTQPDLNGNPIKGPRPLVDNEVDPTQLAVYGIDTEGAGGGMLIDGDRYSSESPIKSMVADAFTQVAQGAIGFHITNFGYMQLVSCFSVFCKKGFYTTRGGYLSISNSVIDFGDEGFVADGYYPDPYGSGLVTQDYYGSVISTTVSFAGSGYTGIPTVYIEPPTSPGGIQAEATASIDPILGIVNAINIENEGSGYDFTPALTISGGGASQNATGFANLRKNESIVVSQLSNKPQVGSVMFLENDPIAYYVTQVTEDNFTFKYDQQKCRRDVGIILDAALADAVLNSNYRSTSAGLSYLRSYSSKVTSAQKAQTIAGINEAKAQALALITDPASLVSIAAGFNIVTSIIEFGSSVAPTIVNLDPVTNEPGYTEASKILLANKQFIEDEIISWINSNTNFSYNEAKCKRDVELIIKAVLSDIVFGSNYQTITAGLAYLRSYSSVVVASQKAQTVAGLLKARDIAISLITDVSVISDITQRFQIIVDLINNGNPGSAPSTIMPIPAGADLGYVNASQQLTVNKSFIVEELISYINDNLSPLAIPGYNETTCRRDAGYLIDAIKFDLLYGGNSATVTAANSYINGAANVVGSQLPEHADVYGHLKDFIDNIILADTAGWTKSVSNTATQNTSSAGGGSGFSASKAQDLVQIIIDVIDSSVVFNGLLVEPTYTLGQNYTFKNDDRLLILEDIELIKYNTIQFLNSTYGNFSYEESTCRRDIRYIVDAMCYDLLYGGNSQTVNAALSYKDGSVISGEIEETKAAYEYWQSIIGKILKNQVVDTTITGQVTNLPIGSPIDPEFPSNSAENLLQIIIDVLDNGTGYIPVNPIQPTYTNGVASLLVERNNILAETLAIQESVIDFLNTTYGGSSRVFTFPRVLSVESGVEPRFHNVSTISTASTALEYVGSGVTYNALPFFGGEPIPKKERVERNYGRCFTVSSDQIGNYRVGEFFKINALSGEIDLFADQLNLSGISSLGPFIRDGVPVGVAIREVSNNANLISSTGSADPNTVPTQPAVQTYVENRYLNKVATGAQTVESDVAFIRDVEIRGADLNTDQLTFNLLNTTATTVNAFGDATTIVIGDSTGTLTINNSQVVLNSTTSLQIPVGDNSQRPSPTAVGQIRYNSETSSFEGFGPGGSWRSLGGVRSVDGLTEITPESAPGASDDILRFYVADVDNVTSKLVVTLDNESLIILNDTQSTDKDTGALIVEGGVGIEKNLNVGANLTVDVDATVTGDLAVNGGDLTTTAATFNLIDANATTVNFGGDATAVNIGAPTGTTSVKNNLEIQGTSLTTTQTTFNLLDTTTTTVNFAGAGTAIHIGSPVGTTTIKNNLEVDINTTLGLDTDSLNIINGKLTVNLKDNVADIFTVRQGTNNYIKINTDDSLEVITFGVLPRYEFLNTTDTTSITVASTTFAGGVGIAKKLFVGTDLNVASNATIGDAVTNSHSITGSVSVTVADDTLAAFQIKENSLAYFTVSTTNSSENITFESTPQIKINNVTDSTDKDTGALVVEGGVGIEKNLNVGANLTVDVDATVTGDLAVNGGDLTTTAATFNLIDANATTVNFAGAATTIDIGASTGTLTINNTQVIFNSTDSIQLPVGNVAQRDLTPVPGQIRYNSELSSFEGYGPGNNWGSLGGVKDVDGNTYIIPETAPAANENILYFYNNATQTLTLAETLFDLKVGVDAVINSTTASTTKTTGALVVVGGVGIGGTVNANELTLTTDLEVQYGGTGQSTFTENGVIYGNNASGLLVTAESNPGSNATTSYGILTTDINNVPVWTDVIDGGSY